MYKTFRENERMDLDLDVYKCLFRDFRKDKLESITFTGGGEPLMNKHAVEMIEIALDQDLELGLITNGILLNIIPTHILRSFKFIRISIDAPDAHTYKKVKGAGFFDTVLENTRLAIAKAGQKVTIGWSYVVCDDNVAGISAAKKLAKEVEVAYIQFKPAWMGGKVYEYHTDAGAAVYAEQRYIAEETMPCMVAGLIGVIGANAKVYYCCQHRGERKYEVGDLNKSDFSDIWRNRRSVIPNISECPMCRYMNYVKKFREIPPTLIKHRSFL
jgi:MoaA/NifB/PqqE/SkfB family radical SAM enzyme